MAKSSKKKKKASKRPARRPKAKRKAKARARKAKATRPTKRKAAAPKRRRTVARKATKSKAAKRKAAPKKKPARRKAAKKPAKTATARKAVKRAAAAVPAPKAAKRVAAPAPAAVKRIAPAAPKGPGFAAPFEGAPVDDLRTRVEIALRVRGYTPPDPVVVDVLTAIGRGYRMGPASPPPWLNVNGPIADGVAEPFAVGDRAHDIDRSTHRITTRASVDIVCNQMAPDVGEPERKAIASFSLGSWNPQVDTNGERNAIAGFVIPWYLAGR